MAKEQNQNNQPGPDVLVNVDFSINGRKFFGAYEKNSGWLVGGARDFNLRAVAPEEIAPVIPDLQINEVTCGYKTGGEGDTQYFLKADLGINISLSDLPLVGEKIPPERSVSIDNLLMMITGSKNNNNGEQKDKSNIKAIIGADLTIGGKSTSFSLPLSGPGSPSLSTGPISNSGTSSQPKKPDTSEKPYTRSVIRPGMVKWFPLNKSIGPLTFKRIGGQYHEAKIHILLDANIALGPFAVSFAGLSVGNPLDKIDPEFNLDGLGLSFSKPPVLISGNFLRQKDEDGEYSYSGMAIIKLETFSIAALGAYKELNGEPSIFIYAALTMAGGPGLPGIIEITGISFGFGYNRFLKAPTIDQVKEFPLVSVVMGGADLGKDPMKVLDKVKQYVPASTGDLFIACGVKFLVVRMLDACGLLILQLGNKNRLMLLGIAKLAVPAESSESLVQVETALKASYDFDEGSLKIEAKLTSNSYIFSKENKLTGGFAFYTWFKGEHKGDFVISIGGYHPDYKIPAHYPKVPRVGFNWNMVPLSLKGEMYFALVPNAIMAGGRLEAVYGIWVKTSFLGITLEAKLAAYFMLNADFIISWQPYYYKAELSVKIGIVVVFRCLGFETSYDLNLGAGLKIWGPEFAGIAYVDWSIVSFEIEFGSSTKLRPKPLTWEKFKTSFLPKDNEICTITVEDGIINELEDGTKIITPEELILNTNSAIPSKEFKLRKEKEIDFETWTDSMEPLPVSAHEKDREKALRQSLEYNLKEFNKVQKDFGIGSMDIKSVINSTHIIKITDTDANKDITDDFIYEPILKNAPESLWGDTFDVKLNSNKKLIDNLLMGFRIMPKPHKKADQTEDKAVKDFSYDIELKANSYKWIDPLKFTQEDSDNDRKRRKIIQDSKNIKTNADRKSILESLGLDTKIIDFSKMPEDTENAFLVAPEIISKAA